MSWMLLDVSIFFFNVAVILQLKFLFKIYNRN